MTDKQITKLIADTEQMAKEWRLIVKDSKDIEERKRATRWLDTIHRIVKYAIQCRDAARGRR